MKKYNIELEVEFRAQTLMAILVNDGCIQSWISKSLIESPDMEELSNFEPGDHFELVIPEWLAAEKELI